MYRIRLGCAVYARMNSIPVRPLSAWKGEGVGYQARRMMYIVGDPGCRKGKRALR